MRQIRTTLLAAMAILAIASTALADVSLMTIDQLAGEIGQDNLLIVDVRSNKDWDSSNLKITDARRMAPNDTGWITEEPKGRRIVLYCA